MHPAQELHDPSWHGGGGGGEGGGGGGGGRGRSGSRSGGRHTDADADVEAETAAGGNDPTRALVALLRSRWLPDDTVRESIAHLGRAMPTKRQEATAEAGGQPLAPVQTMARLVVPVLLIAHLKGEFRWCAHCLKLAPDQDLPRCGGCKQVAYCELAEDMDPHVLKHMHHPRRKALLARVPCHVAN